MGPTLRWVEAFEEVPFLCSAISSLSREHMWSWTQEDKPENSHDCPSYKTGFCRAHACTSFCQLSLSPFLTLPFLHSCYPGIALAMSGIIRAFVAGSVSWAPGHRQLVPGVVLESRPSEWGLAVGSPVRLKTAGTHMLVEGGVENSGMRGFANTKL